MVDDQKSWKQLRAGRTPDDRTGRAKRTDTPSEGNSSTDASRDGGLSRDMAGATADSFKRRLGDPAGWSFHATHERCG